MLDPNSEKSIYVQIAEIIENDILLGNLREGDQSPSTNEFSKIYQINPATARKGINILVEEGILYKKRGIGMFVEADARKKIVKKRQSTFFKEILPDLLKEANRLEITIEEIMNHIMELGGGE